MIVWRILHDTHAERVVFSYFAYSVPSTACLSDDASLFFASFANLHKQAHPLILVTLDTHRGRLRMLTSASGYHHEIRD